MKVVLALEVRSHELHGRAPRPRRVLRGGSARNFDRARFTFGLLTLGNL